jgi:alpha-D-ribose 1-methylphosphonate 5-triphosphate synthase subunit PhnG
MERRDWMGVLARAPADELARAFGRLGPEPGSHWLRPPEFGSVMVRGRAGGTGAPFNLGEMTVTRAALRLDDGTVGHAYVAGRDAGKARIAALCDALLQGPSAAHVLEVVVRPMQALMAQARSERAAKAAATKVDFFTMARGEDK